MRRYPLVALLLAALMVPAAAGAVDASSSTMEQEADRLRKLIEFEGSPEEKLARCRSVVPIAEDLIATQPDEPRWRQFWLRAHNCIGFGLLDLGRRDTAMAHFRTVMDFNKELFASGDTHFAEVCSVTQTGLAFNLADAGEKEFAQEVFQTLIDFWTGRAEGEPDDYNPRWSLLSLHGGIGEAQEEAGSPDAALATYRRGLALVDRLGPGTRKNRELGVLTIRRAEIHERIALLLRARGDLERALESREEEFDAYWTAWERDKADSFMFMRALQTTRRIADLWRELDDPDYAVQLLETNLGIVKPIAEAVPTYELRDLLADVYSDIGRIQREQDKLEDALANFQGALTIRQRKGHPHSADLTWWRKTALAYADVGTVQEALGDIDGAIANYRKAVEYQERVLFMQPDNETWRQDLQKWKAALARLSGR